MKKSPSQSDELHKSLGIPAYKKLEHDDGVNKKEMPKKGGKGKCDCKK